MVRRTSAGAAAILAAILALVGLWAVARVQSENYRFEAVSAEIPVGKSVRVEARLTGPDGKLVQAEHIQVKATRLDMGPDGMATMAAPLTPVASDAKDVLAFKTDIVMAGRWALTIEAAVKGHAEPVKGSIIYTAFEKKAEAAPAGSPAGERRIVYYRNPMGLPGVSPVPKKDSMGMDYIPVYEDEVSGPAGSVRVSLDKVQRGGVRIEPVAKRMLSRSVRGAGTVMADESRLAVVTAKFSGFIERLAVRTTGETVEKGAPVLSAWIESDDVLRKQADYLTALSRGESEAAKAARNLRLFDIPESVIGDIARNRAPVRVVTFNAPAAGTVLEKPAIDGMRFQAGDMLFKIADLSTVWVMAEIAEQDLGLVQAGQTVRLTFPAMPGEPVEGKVAFVYPDLDTTTRSGRIRIVVPNEDGRLKLGLFAHADIEAPVSAAPVAAIPVAAVIDDGTRKVAFVAKGDGLFEPRDLVLGGRGSGYVEVREGLAEGEAVVTAGTFLIDAESNLKAALAAFTAQAVAQ